MNKLYLDDLRLLPDDSYILARSYDEAVKYVKQNGIPNFISFDHDLGSDNMGNILKDGYDFAKWLVDMDIENIHKFPDDFSFNIHSANPIGRNNINSILNNYLIFKVRYKDTSED